MTAVMEPESTLLKGAPPSSGPYWLRRLREDAWQRFTELGFPTTHQEDWRFTNVAPIARTAFERAPYARLPIDSELYKDLSFSGLVFVNGYLCRELSQLSLPPGVSAGNLAANLDGAGLAQYADYRRQPFVALNTAFVEDAAIVHIAKGSVVDEPIHLVFLSAAGQQPSVSHPRAFIVVGENAQVTLVESYIGSGSQVYFTNAVTEIVAGENSIVEHYKIQLETQRAYHVATVQVQQGRGCNFASQSISFGGALVRNDINSVLSEGSECTLNGLYVAGGEQHIDNHTAIDHAKPHGTSHELYRGILAGRASAVFNGKILVRKDAQKTDAKQTNKNLMLSEDAVINTKPELQIYADDVRCTHGATIGQLDAEGIFYLRSRGIDYLEARNMLTFAFAHDIIERVKVEPLRERLEKILFARLNENRR